ncbi:Hypothetical_protein [Hexamita inflata]|uniref:Hypothetical_protein n=1 Tax=Hexamita inflata TaxID=28002 RepID=A0AA86U9F4_9EUKA|nr:Hypothetical protein HINF_LOCUS30212 [Hexamita inflata]
MRQNLQNLTNSNLQIKKYREQQAGMPPPVVKVDPNEVISQQLQPLPHQELQPQQQSQRPPIVKIDPTDQIVNTDQSDIQVVDSGTTQRQQAQQREQEIINQPEQPSSWSLTNQNNIPLTKTRLKYKILYQKRNLIIQITLFNSQKVKTNIYKIDRYKFILMNKNEYNVKQQNNNILVLQNNQNKCKLKRTEIILLKEIQIMKNLQIILTSMKQTIYQ